MFIQSSLTLFAVAQLSLTSFHFIVFDTGGSIIYDIVGICPIIIDSGGGDIVSDLLIISGGGGGSSMTHIFGCSMDDVD